MIMTRTRKLILAAAALATLGTAALSATEASAFGFRHGGFHHFGFRSHWSHFSHYRYHWHWNRYHFAYHRWPHYRPYYWRTDWRGPAYYGAVSSAPVQAPVQIAAPRPARPACIVKQYSPQGAVMFIDRCTQE